MATISLETEQKLAVRTLPQKLASGTVEFVRELATYYMDFLETDFHRRREPKRAIRFRNADNLLVGVNVSRYPVFVDAAWKLIRSAFDKQSLDRIVKGTYRTTIPKSVLDLIQLEIKQLSKDQLTAIRGAIAQDIYDGARRNHTDYEQAVAEALDAVASRLKAELILPFVGRVTNPLSRLDLADENTLFLIEDQLGEVLIEPARNKISELIRRILTGQVPDVSDELAFAFSKASVQRTLVDFFSGLAVGDLFTELYELERNRSILENQEFYLYFGEIAYNGSKYPIFYIPLVATLDGEVFSIEFGAQVYLNKRALEFIVQEENTRTGKKGALGCTAERIIYLAQEPNAFPYLVNQIFTELRNFFQLDKAINITDSSQQIAKSASVRVTNSLYIALSDNSDEAMLNDYEQILQLLSDPDSPLGAAFCRLVDDFIHHNPESVAEAVADEWDSMAVPDRLVDESPIPLNSEQRQILLALRKDKCKYTTVEGPPGTGKSHTITAIVCDAVLRNQSVLVLSDKKEALDVVEQKITETLNRVRTDQHFQNPILRLGKTRTTYAQILSVAVMEGIKAHYRAVKRQHDTIQQSIQQSSASLKEDIEAEALGYEDIDLTDIEEWARLDRTYATEDTIADFSELERYDCVGTDLATVRTFAKELAEMREAVRNGEALLQALGLEQVRSLDELQRVTARATELEQALSKSEHAHPRATALLDLIGNVSSGDLAEVRKFLERLLALKKPLIGYLLAHRQLEAVEREFKARFPFASEDAPHAHLADLQRYLDIATFLCAQATHIHASIKGDWFAICRLLLTQPGSRALLRRFAALRESADSLAQILAQYPKSLERWGIRTDDWPTVCENRLTQMSEADFTSLVRYVTLTQELRSSFRKIPSISYVEDHASIRDVVTVYMTYVMDGRVLDFYQNQKNTAKALREVIKSKQRFPQDEFRQLKDAFPCILAGIRDYAEYIPLEPEMFDLLVIDEASQVSIAQAFPALLRAKKILILGDKKQFSNVKAVQARSDTNRLYVNRLNDCFRRNVSNDSAKLAKLDRFNIRTSVLEFFEFISNYHTQLLKHFRGYKELISYSNETFYRDSLQVMKIRAKAVDDVLCFTELPDSGQSSGARNVNDGEVQFIVAELRKLKEIGARTTVGIITPHTDQQKALVDAVSRLPERGYLESELKLKIMTFDTCQGEERDIVFYSMVANRAVDRLWGVFIKDLATVDLEEDGKIKAQRLNVGFSRAKECMHFVVSKPLGEFAGAVGEALRHFANVREEAKKERSVGEVDQRSAREAQVLNWFYQTQLWKEERERLELVPQFELGKYLKQLDPLYSHPKYRVDFLLLYRPAQERARTLIIEYDGFREHFGEGIGVTASNYESYYSEEDVYRQKVLESYGYRFLRINRFNVGDNPVTTLDARLRHLLKDVTHAPHNHLIECIQEDVEQQRDGELKECPKCRELRNRDDFRDASLRSGVGRFCKHCKGRRTSHVAPVHVKSMVGPNACPNCGSRMLLRTGRYGQFYGCSKFPYCKATRRVSAPTRNAEAVAGVRS